MIPKDKIKFLIKRDIKTDLIKQKEEKAKEKEQNSTEKRGETEIIPADIKDLIKNVHSEDPLTSSKENDKPNSGSLDDFKPISNIQNDDDKAWTTDINIKDFIVKTLKEAGVKFNDSVIDQLFVAVIQAMLDGKLDIKTDINSVTTLIDINLRNGNTLEGVNRIQELINNILGQSASSNQSTIKDVKSFILEELEKINKENEDNNTIPGNVNPGTDPNVNPDPDPNVNPDPVDPNTTEPTVIDTPEKAINAIANLIDNTSYTENTSIKDFLLQFKSEASQYLQMQFGYEAQFADVIAMFLATAVSDTSGITSGLMKDAELSTIKEKFLNMMQNPSFLDTSEGVTGYSPSIGQFDIIYLLSSKHRTENGYRIGYAASGSHITDDSFAYNPDGTANNANFLKFLVEYLKNDVYGGRLNSTQMEAVMKKVINDNFGKGYTKTQPYGFAALPLFDNRIALDKNGDGTFFNELLAAMMNVANNTIKPLNTDDLTEADPASFINKLFGTKTSLSASQIYSGELSYLLSNNLGVRGIIQALVNISEQYNIHNAEDYKDFLNVFIRMIYEKCGEEVVKDSNGNPLLTKDILQKYFAQGNTVQDLKKFIESKDLRNAYYMEYVLEDGGIDDILDEYGFNQKVDGDCWLVACLHALNASEAGKKIIADAVTDNHDGTWTVTFNVGWVPGRVWNSQTRQYEDGMVMGAGQTSYTISLDEFFDALGTGWYGGGDPTLNLIEIATAKLRQEFDTWGVWDGWNGDMYLWGGLQTEMLKYLIGPYNEYEHSSIYVQKSPSNNPDYAAQQVQKIKNWVYSKLDDGSVQEGTVGNYMMYLSYGGHAYAVTGVTRNGIYYIDPFHPETVKFISWADLEARKVKGSDGKYSTVSFIEFGYVELPTE